MRIFKVIMVACVVYTIGCGIRVGTVNISQGEPKSEVSQDKTTTTDTEASGIPAPWAQSFE